MPTSRAPHRRRPLRRARILASTGVALSVLLNVWAVAMAQDLEGPVDGGRTPGSTPSATAGVSGASVAPSSVVQRGDGTFTVVSVPVVPVVPAVPATPAAGARSASTPTSPPARNGAGPRVVRFTVETEGKIVTDPDELARTVVTVLGDPRGWQTIDAVRFVNVTPTQAAAGSAVDVRITLASPETTDRLCAPLETRGEVSCHNKGRAVLNLRRWQLGVTAYGKDLAAYRTYLVNHEVGHALGHGHVGCPGAGRDAPVMMQQSYGLDGCLAWPWPRSRA